jgi:16S rRNA (cytosine1402-N4)-methyltransferase
VSNFEHKPVMLMEVVEALQPKPHARLVDGTVGGAGHAAAMLERMQPSGCLFGCDRDGAAVEAAQQRLSRYAGQFEIRRGNFSELADWIEAGSCDGVLLDLGVSSPQLDVAERGFSFMRPGKLDMRMDQRQELTAAKLVNEASVEELARIFWEYGDERDSRRIARAIDWDRKMRPFETTKQLADLMEKISPRRGSKAHPATKVFQALRIAVNEEMGSLQRGLDAAIKILKPGGRLAVITFHSLEDRAVKEWGRKLARDYEVPGNVDVPELRKPVVPKLKAVNRKAIKPSDAEIDENPRSRSAQLRVFEKV